MCQAQSEGGQRCAAHTRPAYEAALTSLGAAVTDPNVYNQMYKDRWELTDEADATTRAVAEYASTREGEKKTAEYIAEHRKTHGNSNKFAMFLTRARLKGLELGKANKETAAAIKKEQAKAERAARNSMVEMVADPKMTFERSHAAKYPELAAMWHSDTTLNKGVRPDQVAPKKNAGVYLQCPVGHTIYGRLNNYANAFDRDGRLPYCEECRPRRQAAFKATQEELGDLVHALGDDPDAFNALSPALQYSLMNKLGLLRGSQDSMNREVAMSIVHGDLTLKDVVLATDLTKVEDHVRENLDDDDDLNAALSDIDIHDEDDSPNATVKVDQVLSSAGALSLIDPDSELAANIARENNEALWAQAYTNAADLDEYTASLNAKRGRSPQADAAIDRFAAELEAVRATPLPDGYVTERLDRDGNTVSMEPSLAQRRFAALVEDRRRVMNWSGTGAGKTLAASLAVQGTGSQETIVICPKAVIGQWQHEFTNGFPDNTEVIIGLPTAGQDLAPPPPGMNRIWIANYDKFQSDPDQLRAQIGPLADRVDAIIYDEIHMAKASDEATSSLRRKALIEFTDRAGATNPDLVVIGASATPVVNNLEEAKSVLRLVEGPESKGFPTKSTIKNAAAAHHRLAAAGIRNLPVYETTLQRNNVDVDITANVAKVQARVNALLERSGSKKVTPAMMERALLPEKMPKILAKVKANARPTMIYTEYTTGIVGPMKTALEAEGHRVVVYTGTETEAEQKEALRRFRNGEADVLIGSRPIATGVDGLQHTCDSMVVASMAWTAAQDDQLVGRLFRRGQQKNVTVDYILTEAKVGKIRWSWCKDNRQKRVHFKRDIANAAVDGVLPDGALDDNKQQGAEKALGALKDLTAALAKRELVPA